MNVERLIAVRDAIADPNQPFNMADYKLCICGTAIRLYEPEFEFRVKYRLEGVPVYDNHQKISERGREILDLDDQVADNLFKSHSALEYLVGYSREQAIADINELLEAA